MIIFVKKLGLSSAQLGLTQGVLKNETGYMVLRSSKKYSTRFCATPFHNVEDRINFKSFGGGMDTTFVQ